MSAHKPIAVEALQNFRLKLRFPDGVAGAVDLSHLAGKGVFQCWLDDYANFQDVRIAPHGHLLFRGDLDLCSDALYLELAGKSVEEVFPQWAPLQHA